MKNIRVLLAASVLLIASNAHAVDFNINSTNIPNQATFNALSDDMGAAIWMNSSNSAEAHSSGIIPVGIQAAIEVANLSVDTNAWDSIGVTGLPSALPIPRLRISAGIPFGLDLGYMKTIIPNSNVEVTGFEGRMAFGNYIPVPMLEANVRLYRSSMTGVTDWEVSSSGYAAMVGANLPIFKPYFEIGSVKTTSTPSGNLALLANTYETTQSTMSIGAKIELALFIINLEKSTVGDQDLTTVKLGFEF